VSNDVAKKEVFLMDMKNGTYEWHTADSENRLADQDPVPYNEGFVVEIPTNRPKDQYDLMMFIGRVPTNTMTQIIQPKAYNLVNMRLPARMHPSQMNLLASGFKGGSFSMQSDRLRKLDRYLKSTGQDVWYNTTDQSWRYTGAGTPPASDFYIGPDDGFLIWTRGSTNAWTWTNAPPYNPPTRLMNP
jgi:hypothetical protein